MNPWLILAALLLVLAGTGAGYVKGGADNEASHVAADLAAAKAQAEQNRKTLAAEQTARLLAQALEDQAYAEPVQAPACLPHSRVLRLNRFAAPAGAATAP